MRERCASVLEVLATAYRAYHAARLRLEGSLAESQMSEKEKESLLAPRLERAVLHRLSSDSDAAIRHGRMMLCVHAYIYISVAAS